MAQAITVRAFGAGRALSFDMAVRSRFRNSTSLQPFARVFRAEI
jgi:hypothetical protein